MIRFTLERERRKKGVNLDRCLQPWFRFRSGASLPLWTVPSRACAEKKRFRLRRLSSALKQAPRWAGRAGSGGKLVWGGALTGEGAARGPSLSRRGRRLNMRWRSQQRILGALFCCSARVGRSAVRRPIPLAEAPVFQTRPSARKPRYQSLRPSALYSGKWHWSAESPRVCTTRRRSGRPRPRWLEWRSSNTDSKGAGPGAGAVGTAVLGHPSVEKALNAVPSNPREPGQEPLLVLGAPAACVTSTSSRHPVGLAAVATGMRRARRRGRDTQIRPERDGSRERRLRDPT